jgi:hypothetical protein
MTLFFNLENLDKEAGGDYRRYVELLYRKFYNKLPTKRSKPVKLNLNGTSFILNPAPLFLEKIDIAYLIQYIKLAGMRDYTLYKQYGVTSLPLSYFPDVNIDNIKHNPLLTITEDSIFFRHERK